MLLGHVLMPSLVLGDDVPKLLDGVFLIEESCLHSIWVYSLGTCIQLILKHVYDGVDHDGSTNVLLHVFCTHLQVIVGGLSH